MARMGPLEYAKKYWDLDVSIINDDNEIVRYEKVKFGKYRLYQGGTGMADETSAVPIKSHRPIKGVDIWKAQK